MQGYLEVCKTLRKDRIPATQICHVAASVISLNATEKPGSQRSQLMLTSVKTAMRNRLKVNQAINTV